MQPKSQLQFGHCLFPASGWSLLQGVTIAFALLVRFLNNPLPTFLFVTSYRSVRSVAPNLFLRPEYYKSRLPVRRIIFSIVGGQSALVATIIVHHENLSRTV